jgi:hypothetical protein
VNRLIERCAMLDVHKSQITACVRVPDGEGGRRQEIREFAATTLGPAHAGGLAAQLCGERGRDGVHRSTGGRFSTWWRTSSTAGSTTPGTCVTSRPQERRARRRVGLPAGRARAGAAELRAAAPAASAARPGPLPQGQDPGARPRGTAGREDAAGRGDQALLGRLGASAPRRGGCSRREATERYRWRLIKQLERLGHRVTLQPLPEAA